MICRIVITVTLCEFYNSVRVCKRQSVTDAARLFEGGYLQGFVLRDNNTLMYDSEIL